MHPTAAAAALLLALGLGGCAHDTQSAESAQSAGPGPSSQSGSWVAPSPTSTIPAESGDGTPTAGPTAPVPPVGGAYPGAGGAIPADATRLTPNASSAHGYEGVEVHSPSGNVRCILIESIGYAGCGSDAVGLSGALGPDTARPDFPAPGETPSINFVSFGEVSEDWRDFTPNPEPLTSPILIYQHEQPFSLFVNDQAEPYILKYGSTASYGRFACASETNGMTCWDSTTGHGAFLNKETIEVF